MVYFSPECIMTQAIHIDIARSLDRLIPEHVKTIHYKKRQAKANQIRSNSGGNFVKEEKDLWEVIWQWNQDNIHALLLPKDMKWISNPPAGSHHRKVWQRWICTVRQVMKAILKEQRLDEKGLVTLVYEAEAIVNGQPLRKVSDNPRDP